MSTTTNALLRVTLSSVICTLLTITANSQGVLTPPGAPAPMMKTLQQIEPRTPISSLPYTISAPGSYYLTGPLNSTNTGITVAANDVTIDLMGFTISGARHRLDAPDAKADTQASSHNGANSVAEIPALATKNNDFDFTALKAELREKIFHQGVDDDDNLSI